MKIENIDINCLNVKTELCTLGEKHSTDKSPHCTDSPTKARHSYTPIYNLLFSNIRYDKIRLLELGILRNASMRCWRDFFPSAELVGAELHHSAIELAKKDNLPNTTYHQLDVRDEENFNNFINSVGLFDIIIDDTTHLFDDQNKIIHKCTGSLNTGGIFIIEDIFRRYKEKDYIESLKDVEKYFSHGLFVTCSHELADVGTWDNDKLLILFRNDVPI